MVQDPALLRVVRMQLAALKAQLAATHASIQAFEEILNVPVEEDTPPAPPASTDNGAVPLDTVLPGECPHPANRRTDAAAMGKPHRFICQECGETVNG